MADWVKVATTEDLDDNGLCSVEAGGVEIVVVRTDEGVFALEDCCSHQEYPLSEGEVEDGTVECALHGARFDVKTGKALSLPAIKPVDTYEVDVQGSDIYVKV